MRSNPVLRAVMLVAIAAGMAASPAAAQRSTTRGFTIGAHFQGASLKVEDDEFSVGLSFGGVPTTLTVPFAAVTEFVDPAVDFSLKFQTNAPEPPEEHDDADNDAPAAAQDGSNVVNVDFTKKK